MMKMRAIIFSLTAFLIVHHSEVQIVEGEICHADPELSEYNYAGLWERFENRWLCNYWQFFSKDEQNDMTIIIEQESQNDEKE